MIRILTGSANKNIYLLYLVLSLLFYSNSLKNKYALDDNFVTVTNKPEAGRAFVPDNDIMSKGFRSIPKIWRSRYAHDGEGSFDYRPFTTTTFAIEYGIFGQNPFVSHLVNILLYFISICVVHKLVVRLFEAHSYKNNLAFMCALIFLVHPLHTEVVDNLKSRDEILSFLFSCLAVFYSVRYYDEKQKKDILLTIVCFLLGMFSKRTATTTFVVIPMALYFFRSLSIKKSLLALVLLFVVFVSFAVSKKFMLNEVEVRHFYHFENSLYFAHPSLPGRIMVSLKVLGFYVQMLVFPFPMRFYYGESMLDLSAGLDLYGLVGIGFLGLCGWYFFKTRNRYFLFALLLFLGTLAPFLNFLMPVAGIVGDRLSYAPSLGFCLMLALVILPYFKSIDFRKPSLSVFTTRPFAYVSVLVLICMVYVINRNSNWRDKFTLFSHDIVYLENSSKGNSLLANEYFEKMNASRTAAEAQQNAEHALEHYKQSVRADSSMFSAANNAGVVLFTFYKNYDEAARFFKIAIGAKADYAQAYENLGNTYKMRMKFDTAMLMYQKAIALNDKQYASYDAVGQLYGEQKKFREAEKAYDVALSRYPGEYYFSAQKANFVFMDGRQEEGLGLFEKAFVINPNEKLGLFIADKYKALNNSEKEAYYRNYKYNR